MRITIPKKLETTGIPPGNLVDASPGTLRSRVVSRVGTETRWAYLRTGAISFSSVNQSSTISTSAPPGGLSTITNSPVTGFTSY